MRGTLICICWLASAIVAAATNLQQHRVDFTRAEQALRAGDQIRFEQLLARLSDYPLYPYLRYRSLRTHTERQADVDAFLQKYPDSPYAGFLRRRLLRRLASEQRWAEFVDHYRPDDDIELACHYHQARFHLGHQREAMAQARRLWLVGRSRPDGCDGLFRLWQTHGGLTPDLAWRRLALAMENGNGGLARYLTRHLAAPDRAAARLWQQIHKKPQRVLACDGWSPTDPRHGRIFADGIGRLARRRPLDAANAWRARKAAFSIDPQARARAEQRIGIALAKQRHRQALEFLAALPPERHSPATHAWQIRSALLFNRWPEALAALEQLTADQRSEPRWRYWRARTLAALGRRQEANQLYRALARDRSFYGFLAADRLGLDYSEALRDRPAAVDPAIVRRLEQSRPIRAAREFIQMGRNTDARREWRHALHAMDREELLAAAKIAQRWQWHQTAITTIARAEYWDDLTLRFPLLYRSAVIDNAHRHGLDPALVLAVIRRESLFDPAARSPAGARGLMQIMPATGRGIARRLHEPWRSATRLQDPDLNIRYGTFYLSELLRRFDHNAALATAAYNAGPGRVRRWRPAERPMPADLWVELIPFDETRQYVTTVLAHAMTYHRRLQRTPPRLQPLLPDIAFTGKQNASPATAETPQCADRSIE